MALFDSYIGCIRLKLTISLEGFIKAMCKNLPAFGCFYFEKLHQ